MAGTQNIINVLLKLKKLQEKLKNNVLVRF